MDAAKRESSPTQLSPRAERDRALRASVSAAEIHAPRSQQLPVNEQLDGRRWIQRGNNEVVLDLPTRLHDYDFIFKNCAVGVVRFPKRRMKDCQRGNGG